jgi:hypothetical protein
MGSTLVWQGAERLESCNPEQQRQSQALLSHAVWYCQVPAAEFPARGFASLGGLDDARAWGARFVQWYNVDHRYNSIGYHLNVSCDEGR